MRYGAGISKRNKEELHIDKKRRKVMNTNDVARISEKEKEKGAD